MKKKCQIHPEKTALSFCHICGEYFCEACLSEGIEYYYCPRESCQKFYRQELAQDTIDCLNCGETVKLAHQMRIAHTYDCPHCHQTVKYRRELLNPLIITDYAVYPLTIEPFDFHRILFSLNTNENNTLKLVVYEQTHLDVILNARNEYGLRYHYQASDSACYSVRDDLSSVEVVAALTGFINHQHAWKETIEWEAEAYPRNFWELKIGRSLKKGFLWFVFGALVQSIFYIAKQLVWLLMKLFEYLDKW
ncbi:hypothetical protein L0128_14470 [candidate division KSB1 bacterium]|nr:hypothetical protein [candidate division KSB1 bacterium]